MAIRKILQLGNPVLWELSKAVADATSDSTVSLIHDLRDTLAAFRKEHGFGRGIAAPQINVSKRVIYIEMGQGGFHGALINPEITWGDTPVDVWDSCFCFPELMVKVVRASGIHVSYVDEAGKAQKLEVEGELCELLQHEIDHLDGILAVYRAKSPRAFSTREEWMRMGGNNP
ncbi:MAG: peptide deformylase [Planctomycetota bacterium]